MLAKPLRPRHPSPLRRLIANFSIFGETLAASINKLGVALQKVANGLRFEHFWKKYVVANPDVIILPSFTKTKSKHSIWDIAMERVKRLGDSGTLYEFGTNNGGSLLYFWKHLPGGIRLHGLDCFEGIPEPWDSLPKGSIKGYGYPCELWKDAPEARALAEKQVTETGTIPQPPQENITIHKGLFAHTLSGLLANGVPKDVRFIHFDADIYSATRPVLDAICGQIDYKYYVLFDEFYSVNHEFKAWLEFTEFFAQQHNWRVIATTDDGVQVLFEVN